MAKFACYGKVVGTKYLGEVDAATTAEAMRLAHNLKNLHVSVCPRCADQISDPEIDEIFVDEME